MLAPSSLDSILSLACHNYRGRVLVDEYPSDMDSDYVFVNIWAGDRGAPMTYEGTRTLINTLRKRTGLYFRWHMFRHTHATDLLHNDWDMALVQKRLGHKSIQTTVDTYAHLNDNAMRRAHQEFLKKWQQ
ncbi:MAG: tyrosine-type recombinase/integrase [Cyanobacteria bacterium J06627_32]